MKTKEIWDRVSNIALHLKMAEQGDTEAQCKVGFAYWYGYYGLPEDKTLAFQWYQKAAIRGNAKAQNNLGYMYQYGLGVAEDSALAIKWYQKAAEQGLAIAQCGLGYMYDCIENEKLALKWYQTAAEQGSIIGLCFSRLYFSGDGGRVYCYIAQDDFGFISESEWYLDERQECEENVDEYGPTELESADAQYHLGRAYEKGEGFTKDKFLAFEYYQKSAKQGHAGAQYCLGYIYQNKSRIFNTYSQIQWFEQYSEMVKKGDIKPQKKEKIAMCQYISGERLFNNLRFSQLADMFSIMWYRRAAEQGHVAAQESLGWFYDHCKLQAVLGFLWHHKAAKQGSAYSLFRAAHLYLGNYTGLAEICNYTEEDYNMSAIWHFKAAISGNIDARILLGECCEYVGDEATAKLWYENMQDIGRSGLQKSQKRMKYLNIFYIKSLMNEYFYDSAKIILKKIDAMLIDAGPMWSLTEKTQNTKYPLYRRLTMPNQSSMPPYAAVIGQKQEVKSSWDLGAFRDFDSNTDNPFLDEAKQEDILVEHENLINEQPLARIEHNFKEEIDAFLSSPSKRTDLTKWIDLLVCISTHPQALSLSAWQKLEEPYYALFFDEPTLDIRWWVAIRNTRTILLKSIALQDALERWLINFFSRLFPKISSLASNHDNLGTEAPSSEFYGKLIEFLRNNLYMDISSLINKEFLQAQCIEWIALLVSHLYSHQSEEVLLCQAVAVSVHAKVGEKARKIIELCSRGNEVLDKRVRDWQEDRAASLFVSYQDEQIYAFRAAIENASPKSMLQSLANLIQFLFHQQYYKAQPISVNAQMAAIFHSSWLIQEYAGELDHTQDAIWRQFRLLWLKVANLKHDAQEVIMVLKLYSYFLQWLSLQAMCSDHITQAQRRRYLVRLSGMLQNQFLVKDKTFSLFSINEEEKEAIESRLQRYWPQRLSYCAQLNEGTDQGKQQDIRVFWDELCSEAKLTLFPLWRYEDLEQVLPKLILTLSENRKALNDAKKEGVFIQSIEEYVSLKQKGLMELYTGLQALWYHALKRMGIAPPCPYSLVLLGSGARGDATLYSDMEFLMVIEPNVAASSLEDIKSYFSQCFDLFSIQITLLGEKRGDVLGNIPYRLGIHLDDKLIPFKDNDCFFGTVPDLTRYFKLEQSSLSLKWPHYLKIIRGADIPSESASNQKAISAIMAICASYDACFFTGDKKLFTDYLKNRSKVLSESNGLDDYSSRAALALFFCQAAVRNDFFNTGMLAQSIDVKKDFLSVISGTIKTLSLYHGLMTVEGLEIMDTRERCTQLLSRGIISQELATCLETAYLCCDRFRSLTYASYDSAFEFWTLFGNKRFIERKSLWGTDIKLWKEAIVLLHDVIYPLHYALSSWIKIAEQEFKAERVFTLESGVLARCRTTLANDAREMVHRFPSAASEILLDKKLGEGAFLPRLTPNWWQFFLLAMLNLTPIERKNLWKALVSTLSSGERDVFFENWDALIHHPYNLQQQHPYLSAKERETLCLTLASELNRMAAELVCIDGWNLLSYRKQRQWQKNVSALFSDSILNTEDLERAVIQQGSTVVGCVDPAIMPSELAKRRQQGQKVTGLFVLKPFIQAALIEAEKRAFSEARIKSRGKRHVVLFFDVVIEGKVCHFCLKLFPENPGMEYHITRLQTMLGSVGELPEVSLWRIYTPSYPQGIAALLMEDMRAPQYGIEDRILQLSDRAVIESEISIDRESFARHFLRVLWSTPEDDKPNDYYVISLAGGDYKLIRVDNERSLYVSELFEHKFGLMGSASSDKVQALLKIKTIIYCMEQMNLFLPLSILERVIQLDTRAVFKHWLVDIRQWNYNAREIFKSRGIMAQSSSSSSSFLGEEGEWSVARLHCERNIYDHGVFHEALNPLYKKESKNFCLVVMPVPMDKFIQSYLFLEKTRQFFIKNKALKKGLTGWEVLMAVRPEHYQYYHANLAPELRVGANKSDKISVSRMVFDRFEQITQGGYRRDGESASLYPGMVTSGLGKLMERADYERILHNGLPQQEPLEADTAEWLIFTLANYERKQPWNNDLQMMEQILLDRFHKILSVPIANANSPLGFFSSETPFYRQIDLIITEFRNLSLVNKVQFRRYFLNAKKRDGWNIEAVPLEVKKYLLRLLLNEHAAFSDYPLLSLNTEAFQAFLDEKTLLELLQKYGGTLKKAVIVTNFDPYVVPQFKAYLEACVALKHLELKRVIVAPDLQSRVARFYPLECHLPKIHTFVLSGFIAVDAVVLNMPGLRHLIFRSCVNLNKGRITVKKLQCLELYACQKVSNAVLEEMLMKPLAAAQRMPLIKSENTALKRTFLQNTLHKALRYQDDIVSQIALMAPFTVKQWCALELLFCMEDEMQDDAVEYTLCISKILDKYAAFRVLYSNPDFCSDFARALIAVLKLISSVHPHLKQVNIEVTGESADMFGAALSLSCDETFPVVINYNGHNLHKPAIVEVGSEVSGMRLRK